MHICTGPTCREQGSAGVFDAAEALRTNACTTGCLGECGRGPNGVIDGTMYHALTELSIINVLARNSSARRLSRTNIARALRLKATADKFLLAGRRLVRARALYKAAERLLVRKEEDVVHGGAQRVKARILSNYAKVSMEIGDDPRETQLVAERAVDANPGSAAAWMRLAQARVIVGDEVGVKTAAIVLKKLDVDAAKRLEKWKRQHDRALLWQRVLGNVR